SSMFFMISDAVLGPSAMSRAATFCELVMVRMDRSSLVTRSAHSLVYPVNHWFSLSTKSSIADREGLSSLPGLQFLHIGHQHAGRFHRIVVDEVVDGRLHVLDLRIQLGLQRGDGRLLQQRRRGRLLDVVVLLRLLFHQLAFCGLFKHV